MAGYFKGASDNRLRSAAALNLSTFNAVSLSFWIKPDMPSGSAVILEQGPTAYSGGQGRLGFWGDALGDNAWHPLTNNGTTAIYRSTTGLPSAGAWHHYAVNFLTVGSGTPNGAVDSAWQDNTTIGAGSGLANAMSAFANDFLNLMARFDGTTASYWMAGAIEQVAIWASTTAGTPILTAANVNALFTGTAPTGIQSGSLLHYWLINGNEGASIPDQVATGSIALNVVGTMTQVAGHAGGIAHLYPEALGFSPLTGI